MLVSARIGKPHAHTAISPLIRRGSSRSRAARIFWVWNVSLERGGVAHFGTGLGEQAAGVREGGTPTLPENSALAAWPS